MKTKSIKIEKKYINHWCKRHFRSIRAKQFFKSKADWFTPNHQLRFMYKALSTKYMQHHRQKNPTAQTGRTGSQQQPATFHQKGFQSQFYQSDKLSLRTFFFYRQKRERHYQKGSFWHFRQGNQSKPFSVSQRFVGKQSRRQQRYEKHAFHLWTDVF